jgi:hypothetical protein
MMAEGLLLDEETIDRIAETDLEANLDMAEKLREDLKTAIIGLFLLGSGFALQLLNEAIDLII